MVRLRRSLIAIAAIAAFASCGAPDTGATSEPLIDASEAVAQPGFLMPLDAFFGSPTDLDLYAQELNESVRQYGEHVTTCVRGDGFAFYTHPEDIRIPQGSSYGARTNLLREGGYGVANALDSQWRQQQETTAVAERNQAGIAALSDDEILVFNQRFVDCLNEAQELHPEPRPASSEPSEVAQEAAQAREEMGANPRFGEVWAEWAACMREAGFNEWSTRTDIRRALAQPADRLAQRLRFTAGDETPTGLIDDIDALRQREDAISKADIECADRVDLDARLLVIQYELETEILLEHGDRWNLTRGQGTD